MPAEIAASILIAILLAWANRPLTLAVYAGLPFSIFLASTGNTDYMAALLLGAGLLSLPRWWGGVLVGLSVAWKPYTAVFLPALFPSGSAALIAGVAVAAVGYLPAVYWGGFIESVTTLTSVHRRSAVWLLGIPLSLLGLRFGAIAGCGAYAMLTMTSAEWSTGYYIPLIVAAGIAVEPGTLARRDGAPRTRPMTSAID
jgi:hypothetical protein